MILTLSISALKNDVSWIFSSSFAVNHSVSGVGAASDSRSSLMSDFQETSVSMASAADYGTSISRLE